MEPPGQCVNATTKLLQGAWEGENKVVLGIDIGATQSGVAFTFLQNGGSQSIHRVTKWPGQEVPYQQYKVPTLVWYNTNKKPVSFGFEALAHQIEDEAENNGWTLAKHFKLHLQPNTMRAKHNSKLNTLPPGVPLRQIYSDFLGYLLKHTQTYFEDRIVDGKRIWQRYKPSMEVIITHPNGWGIREQNFLREVAIDAKFIEASKASSKIRFVTEAEASVHFCIYHTNLGSQLQCSTNFAICDAGESTTNTTVHSVTSVRPVLKIEEKRVSACIQAGSIYVDLAVERYLRQTLMIACLSEYEIDEYCKAGIKDFNSYMKQLFSDETKNYHIEIAGPRFNNSSIRTRRGRMELSGHIIKSFFDTCVREILSSVDEQLKDLKVSHILLVGNFGDSPYLRNEFRKRYEPQGCQITFTNDSSSKGVADGALIWNIATSANRDELIDPIISHALKDSIQQHGPLDSPSDFMLRLKEILEYYEKESVQMRLKDLKNLQQTHETNLEELRLAMKDKDAKLKQCHDAYNQGEKLRAIQKETEIVLHKQLLEAQQEIASLRLRLQPPEEFKQTDIVAYLKDLNHNIEDICRVVSTHLTEKYVQAIFKEGVAVTTLDARNLPGLKLLLGHVDGKSSLIKSSEGTGMAVTDFFDYSIRALLCTFFVTKIFQPFHPAIESSQSSALLVAYKKIQQQESQPTAGRWRSNTFKTIYMPKKTGTAANHINTLTHEFARTRLNPLITHFFGRKDTTLDRQHFNRLRQLIKQAWEWNLKLKGEVVVLGDFDLIAYDPCSEFDATLMKKLEGPCGPEATSILGTLGLGLVSRRAVGGGQPPEETLVCKAVVVTDSLYA